MDLCAAELRALFKRLWDARAYCDILGYRCVHGKWFNAMLGGYDFEGSGALRLCIEPALDEFQAFLHDVLEEIGTLRVCRRGVIDLPPDLDSSDEDSFNPDAPYYINIATSPVMERLFERVLDHFFKSDASYALHTYGALDGVCATDAPAFAWSDFYKGLEPPVQVNAFDAITRLFGNPLIVDICVKSSDALTSVDAYGFVKDKIWRVRCRSDEQECIHTQLTASDALQLMLEALNAPTCVWPCKIVGRIHMPFECTPAGVATLEEFVQASGV
jgi:hypothetical protein